MVWWLMIAGSLAQDEPPPDPPKRLDASEIEATPLAADGSVAEGVPMSDLPDPPAVDAPVPEAGDGSTWLRMDSGEWIRGSLARLRLDRLTFGSDDLGSLDLDWDDVAGFWSPAPHVWFTTDRRTLIGSARLVDGELLVRTSDGLVAVAADDVRAMIKSDGRELGYWSLDLYAGFSGRWGNARQLNLVGRSNLVRDDGQTRWSTHYDGTYGFTAGVPSANAHTATTQFDVYVHPIVYVTPLTEEVYHDPFQNIRVRNRVGAGLGFRHEASAAVVWSGALQAVHQYQEAVSVADAADAVSNDAGVSVGLDAKFTPAADLSLTTSWKSTIVVTDLGATSHRGLAAVSYKLLGALGLDVQGQYDRIEVPPTRADGTTPVSDDVQVSAGLSMGW